MLRRAMAPPGEDRDAPKWKFVSSVAIWSIVAAIMGVMLFPTMSGFDYAKPDLLWAGVVVIALPSVIAVAYGFTSNLYVGIAALAGFGIATVVYLASKGGACMAAAALIIAIRGAYLLFRATMAQRASASSPQAPPSTSAAP